MGETKKKPTPFGALLRRLRSEAGWSPSYIDRRGGLSKAHFYRYSSGELQSEPHQSTIEKLSDATTLPESVIWDVVKGRLNPADVILPAPGVQKFSGGAPWDSSADLVATCAFVPRYKAAIAAGSWAEVGNFELLDQEDRDVLPTDPHELKKLHAVQIDQGLIRVYVSGDSMTAEPGKSPSFPDGSLVEFRYVRLDREPLQKHLGKPVYVQLSDGRATFKRLDGFDSDSIRLMAINKRKYPKPLMAPLDEVVRIAVVTYLLSEA